MATVAAVSDCAYCGRKARTSARIFHRVERGAQRLRVLAKICRHGCVGVKRALDILRGRIENDAGLAGAIAVAFARFHRLPQYAELRLLNLHQRLRITRLGLQRIGGKHRDHRAGAKANQNQGNGLFTGQVFCCA